MSYIEQFWRPATKADVVRVMDGEEVEARFRDSDKQAWENSRLWGWQGHLPYKWIKATGNAYCECQVYEPPQWWLNKPDPGEGHRLLEKFPDEAVQAGDFAFDRTRGWAKLANGRNPAQGEGVWYRRKIEQLLPDHQWVIQGDRLKSGDLCFDKGVVVEVEHYYLGNTVMISEAFMRKIEQPKPEPKFQVGQRVKIIGGISGPYIEMPEVIEAMTMESTGWFYELRNIEGLFHETNLDPVVEPEPKHYVLQVGDTAELPDGSIVKALELGMEVR